jgi:hypothetical protein
MALLRQLKVSVDHDLAESFKFACSGAGVSMASELSALMAARIGVMTGLPAKADRLAGYDTRAKRRFHVVRIIAQLESIMGYEDAYKSHIPENLQSGPAYDNAEVAVDSLEQVIDLLKDAY